MTPSRRLRRATAAVGATALVGTGLGASPARAQRGADIAVSLGVTPAEVRAAAATPAPEPRPLAELLAEELRVETAAVERIVEDDRTKPGSQPDRTTLLPALVAGLGLDEAVVTAAFDRAEAARADEHRARIAAVAAKLAAAERRG